VETKLQPARALPFTQPASGDSKMPPAAKVPLTQDQDFLDLLLLLRFGAVDGVNYQHPVVSVAAVARVVGKPASTVAKLLKLALCADMLGFEVSPRRRRKFTAEHIDFLVSKQTLISQAHLSLKQRAKMFHRRFPEVRISASTIERLYKQYGVKFKFIARAKREVDFETPYFRDWFYRMRSQLEDVAAKGLRLVFLDEAVFTFNTMATRAWFSAYDCLKLRDAENRIKTMALVAAVSQEKGLEGYLLHPRSISAP